MTDTKITPASADDFLPCPFCGVRLTRLAAVASFLFGHPTVPSLCLIDGVTVASPVIWNTRIGIDADRAQVKRCHAIIQSFVAITDPDAGPQLDAEMELNGEFCPGECTHECEERAEADRARIAELEDQLAVAVTPDDHEAEERAVLRAEIADLEEALTNEAEARSEAMVTIAKQAEELDQLRVFKALTLQHLTPVQYETITTTGTIAALTSKPEPKEQE